ncbi:MAG: hypothetical protein U0791_18950 [Gemmataceae bacterium]
MSNSLITKPAADAGRDGVGRAGRDFEFREPEQVLVIRLVAAGGFSGQFLVLGQHGRQLQLLQVRFEQ